MKNYRKILAGVLATSMVLGSSTVALAAGESGQTTGSGKVEGQAKQEVFSVVLPTESDYTGAFDYVLDPMQLIETAAGDKFDTTKYDFNAGDTVYFFNGEDSASNKLKYSATSNGLNVVNKSNKDVELTVTLQASAVDGITFTDDNTFGGGGSADTSLYLAIEGQKSADTAGTSAPVGSADLAKINSNGVAALSATLEALTGATASDKAFIIQWNPIRNGYEFVEDANASKKTTSYEFKVKGACNIDPAADWLEVLQAGDTPELEIVWSIENPLGAKIALNQTTKKVTMTNLTADQTYKSLTITDETGTYELKGTIEGGSDWDATTKSGSLIFTYEDAWATWMEDKLVTITMNLSDGSSRSVTVVGE